MTQPRAPINEAGSALRSAERSRHTDLDGRIANVVAVALQQNAEAMRAEIAAVLQRSSYLDRLRGR